MSGIKQELEVTDKEFQQEVLQADKPVLAMFWGSWCPVCKRSQPMLEELSGDHNEIKIKTINIDRNPQTASKYKIAGTPTFYLFVDGEKKAMKVGSVTRQQLEEFITDHLTQFDSE